MKMEIMRCRSHNPAVEMGQTRARVDVASPAESVRLRILSGDLWPPPDRCSRVIPLAGDAARCSEVCASSCRVIPLGQGCSPRMLRLSEDFSRTPAPFSGSDTYEGGSGTAPVPLITPTALSKALTLQVTESPLLLQVPARLSNRGLRACRYALVHTRLSRVESYIRHDNGELSASVEACCAGSIPTCMLPCPDIVSMRNKDTLCGGNAEVGACSSRRRASCA